MPTKKTKKTTATKKKATKSRSTHSRKKKAAAEDTAFSTPVHVPDVFTLTPSLTHGHSTYQRDPEFIPSRRPRRNLIMVLGVSLVMVIIVVGWIVSLKRFINANVAAAPENTDRSAEFSNLKDELSSTLDDIKGQLNELDTLREETAQETVTPDANQEMKETFKNIAGEKITAPTPTTTPATLPN